MTKNEIAYIKQRIGEHQTWAEEAGREEAAARVAGDMAAAQEHREERIKHEAKAMVLEDILSALCG